MLVGCGDVARAWQTSSVPDDDPPLSARLWKVRERLVDESRMARLSIAEVELPDGVTFEQYVLRLPQPLTRARQASPLHGLARARPGTVSDDAAYTTSRRGKS